MKHGERQKEKILKAGLELWLEDPNLVNASQIARKINKTHASVLYHFKYDLKDAVAEYALERRNEKVIAQLIVQGHPAADKLSPCERNEYLRRVL